MSQTKKLSTDHGQGFRVSWCKSAVSQQLDAVRYVIGGARLQRIESRNNIAPIQNHSVNQDDLTKIKSAVKRPPSSHVTACARKKKSGRYHRAELCTRASSSSITRAKASG